MCGLFYVCKVWVGERALVTILVSTISYLMCISVVMDCVTIRVLNLISILSSHMFLHPRCALYSKWK